MEGFLDGADLFGADVDDLADILAGDDGLGAVLQHLQLVKGVEQAVAGHDHALVVHDQDGGGQGESSCRALHIEGA